MIGDRCFHANPTWFHWFIWRENQQQWISIGNFDKCLIYVTKGKLTFVYISFQFEFQLRWVVCVYVFSCEKEICLDWRTWQQSMITHWHPYCYSIQHSFDTSFTYQIAETSMNPLLCVKLIEFFDNKCNTLAQLQVITKLVILIYGSYQSIDDNHLQWYWYFGDRIFT